MIFNYFLIGLGLIFFAVALFNILLNKKMRLEQTRQEKIMVGVLCLAAAACGIYGTVKIEKDDSFVREEAYRGYVYLSRGELGKACSSAEKISDKSSENIDALTLKVASHLMNGETGRAAVEIENFKAGSNIAPGKRSRLVKLENMVKESSSDLPDTNAETGSTEEGNTDDNTPQITGKSDELISEISESAEKVKPEGKKAVKIEKLIDIELKADKGEPLINMKEDIFKLAEEHENDADIMKLEAGIALEEGNYNEARLIMSDVVKKDGAYDNKFLLADIYAQECRDAVEQGNYSDLMESNDGEIKTLVKKINEKEKQAEELEEKQKEAEREKDRRKYQIKMDNVNNDIALLRKQIAAVPVKRAINYISNEKPLFARNDGKFDLQMAKLYFAIDKNEKAKELIDSAIKKADNVGAKEDASELVANLKGRNSMIITNVDRDYGNFVVSHIKYSKVNVHIGNIDYSNYPHILASVSVSGHKNGIFGKITDFSQKDFSVFDTDEGISKFKLKKVKNKKGNIALVFDRSGSMNGRPVEDAKSAGGSFIERLDRNYRVSVISFSNDSSVDCSLTSDKNIIDNAINKLEAGGGTNIASGLKAAVDELSSQDGINTVILMSDGQSNDDLGECIRQAERNSITVYTVGFGDVNDGYLGEIARRTGGKFIKADSSVELSHVYENLYSYIANNYELEYDVNPESMEKRRMLEVKLDKYDAYAQREYGLEEERAEAPEDSDGTASSVRRVNPDDFILTGISKSVIYMDDYSKKKDNYIELKGYNLDKFKSISIGNYTSADVKANGNELLKVKLPEKLTEGQYTITGVSRDNKVSRLENAFSICRAGQLTSIKVGDLTIKAASIKKVSQDSFVASGNVRINDFLRFNTSLNIKGYNQIKNGEYEEGFISGKGKLYVSASGNGFVHKMLRSSEIVIGNGAFEIDGDNSDSYLKLLYGNYGIDVGFANFTHKQCKVGVDGIELTLAKFDFSNIELWENLMKKNNRMFPVGGEATVKITGQDVLARIKADFSMDNVAFKWFGVDGLEFELDTIGPERKFALSGDLSLPLIDKGLEFDYESSSDNFLYPEEFTIALNGLKVPLTKVGLLYLDALGGGLGNLSAARKSGWTNAEIVGKSAISAELLPISLPVVGDLEVLEFSDLTFKVRLNFRKFLMSGKMEVFNTELASAEMGLEAGKGFWASAEGELAMSLVIAEFKVNGKYLMSVASDGIILESQAAYDCKAFGKSGSGNGLVRFTFNRDNTIFVIKANNYRVRIAIDNKGSIKNLRKRVHVQFNA